jgi:hypothetical protein
MPSKRKYPRPDPLIDEIRQIRKAIHDRFGGDIAKIAAHANEVARRYRMERVAKSRTKATGKK